MALSLRPSSANRPARLGCGRTAASLSSGEARVSHRTGAGLPREAEPERPPREDPTPRKPRMAAVGADALEQFADYEAYLDSQVSETDMYYLEDEEMARQLVELGYRGSWRHVKKGRVRGEASSAERKGTQRADVPKALASHGKDLSGNPFLAALASREALVRNGKLTSIIFVRTTNAKGQQVSAYIDYAHRLKTEDFGPYLSGEKKLMPKPTDLSYYNWETQASTHNSTPNFQVVADQEGLLFKNKRDRKVVNVDPAAPPERRPQRNEQVRGLPPGDDFRPPGDAAQGLKMGVA